MRTGSFLEGERQYLLLFINNLGLPEDIPEAFIFPTFIIYFLNKSAQLSLTGVERSLWKEVGDQSPIGFTGPEVRMRASALVNRKYP